MVPGHADDHRTRRAQGRRGRDARHLGLARRDPEGRGRVRGRHRRSPVHPRRRRAREADPFGGTIAHGFFTLSLLPYLNEQVFKLEGFAFALNYGLNKVRFPAPVPVGSKVRASPRVKEVTDVQGGAQIVFETTFEVEGGAKPVCVAEYVARVYTGA
jgi:acyl dehydratase